MNQKLLHSILVIVNEPKQVERIQRAFENRRNEFCLVCVHSLQEARDTLLHQALPALILAEQRLTDGAGLDLIPIVRGQFGLEGDERVPVVFISSSGSEAFAVEAMRAGALDAVVLSDATTLDLPHVAEEAMRKWQRIVERHGAGQRHSDDFNAISELAIELAESTPEANILELITQKTKAITGASATILTVYQGEKSCFTLVQYSMKQSWAAKIKQLLGKDLIGTEFPLDLAMKDVLVSEVTGRVRRVVKVNQATVPEGIRTLAQGFLKYATLHVIPLALEGELFGTIAIFTRSNQRNGAVSLEMMQTIGHVVAVALRRKRAEDELRAREERFKSLVQNAYDIIVVLDRVGTILDETPSVERILGYSLEDLIGKNCFDYIHPADSNALDKSWGDVIQKSNNQAMLEFRIRHANGSWVNFEGVGKNLLDSPVVHGVVVTLRDITDRKRGEAELQRVNRALRVISECNQALVRAVDEPSLLHSVCQTIATEGGYAHVWIGFVQNEDKRMSLVHQSHYGGSDEYLRTIDLTELSYSQLSEIARKQFKNNQPLLLQDLEQSVEIMGWQEGAIRHGYRSAIIFQLEVEKRLLGFLAIFTKEKDSFDPQEVDLLKEMANDLAYGIQAIRVREERNRTDELLQQSNLDLARAYDATLEGWARALELRERETANHGKRVVEMALDLARKIGMQEDDLVHIRRGALLHDIGKMGIPDSILLKPGPLTADEQMIMYQHPRYAFELLEGIPFLESSLDIPYAHHERWNGSGYPRGLKGKDIPLSARLFMVVDVWDALSNQRPYRQAWPESDVRTYLREMAGILFDPEIVKVFLDE